MLSERPQGSLPGNMEPNLREQVKAVTLRSVRELHSDTMGVLGVVWNKKVEVREDKDVEKDQATTQGKEKELDKEKYLGKAKTSTIQHYKPPIPYPGHLKKDKEQEHFSKFLDLFKQLHINIPFVEALA